MQKVENLFLREQAEVNEQQESLSVAVHLHLFYLDLLPHIVDSLKLIPVPFALFISVPESVTIDVEQQACFLRAQLQLSKLKICRTPNRGRDIAPLLCTFGEDLRQHDIMLHLHTKKSPHAKNQSGWFSYILHHLLPTREDVRKILFQLTHGTGIIAPPNYLYHSVVNSWSNPQNLFYAQQLLDRAKLQINLEADYPEIDFPQGSMFWARTSYLERLFSLGLQYEDFPGEPIGVDGTVAHALERLFFVWGYDSDMSVSRAFLSKMEASEQQRFKTEHERLFSDMKILSRDNQVLSHDCKLYASECQRMARKNAKNLVLFRVFLYLSIALLVSLTMLLLFVY